MSEDTYKMLTAFSGMGNFMRGKLEGLTFSGMQDTPTGYESGKYLVSTTSGVEWTDAPASGDSSTFAALTDTPTGYESGKYLVSTASGVEWTNAPVGGSSSAGGGAFANSESGIYWSNFYTGVPDAIMLPDSNGNENILNLNQLLLSDEIYYEARYYTNEFKGISFKNDDIGEVGSYQAGIGGAVTSLSGILDEGRALYYGGSSSSGGAEEGYLLDQFLGWINSGTSESVVLDGKSEYLVTILNRGSDSTYLHVPFWHSFNIDSSDGTISLISDPGGNKVSTSYDNETDTLTIGANSSQIYEVKVFKKTQAGGGSSTFAALTDTPTELTADKYLKVNTEGTALELVDAPVSSGGGSSVVVGNYVGDGEEFQEIILGFRPAVVHIQCTSSPYYGAQTQIEGMVDPNAYQYAHATGPSEGGSWAVQNVDNDTMIVITDTGFKVYVSANNSGMNHLNSNYSYYALAASSSGGGSSGGASFGLIASKMTGVNFAGELPDVIFQKDTTGLEAALILQQITDDVIKYGANTAGTNRTLQFDNSVTAGNMVNNGTWELGSNSPGLVSVQHFIDNDKAVYFGGGSSGGSSTFAALTDTPTELTADKYLKVNAEGTALELVDAPVGSGGGSSGGIGSTQAIRDVSNFAVDLPDALYVNSGSTGLSIAYLQQISSSRMIYRVANTNANIYLTFDNDSSGTLFSQTNVVANAWSTDTSIQGYIDAGKAIYTGGSSSSGGAGSSAEIKSRSNFNSTIPDQMIVKHNDGSASIYQLRYVSTTLISYHDTISTHSAGQRRIMFNNDPSGTMNSIEGSGTDPGDQPFEGATATLQDIIDGGHAIYIGGSSGSSSENGIGNLPYIKNKTNFNGRLPDAILAIGPDPNNWDKLMHLDEYLKDTGIFYKSNDAGFMFNDDPTGTMKSHSGTHTLPNGTNTTIQDMIDAGRAMYYG